MEHERAEAHLQYAEKDGSHIRQSIQAKLSNLSFLPATNQLFCASIAFLRSFNAFSNGCIIGNVLLELFVFGLFEIGRAHV